jgi:nucleoside phosphorylase
MTRQLRHEDYTVGWVCALSVELAAAQEMLDERHKTPPSGAYDTNIYTCGRIGEHNVVIACLPEGQTDTHSAAAVAAQMRLAFISTRFGLMVGIGGGVPSEEADVRLGDVVVSKPHKVYGGVVQYDSGKATPSGFERTGSLDTPPTILLNAVANLRANHFRGKCRLAEYLCKLERLPDFTREAAGPDTLFAAMYNHKGPATCRQCDTSYLADREPRRQELVVHYGTIASGNQVMRSATERDRVSAELGGVLCFEMEAAGLMNNFPCLVIRGICDYADSHKNKRWQPYAAATAASYAKELLSIIPLVKVVEQRTVQDAVNSSGDISHPTNSDLNTAIADLASRKGKRLNWQEYIVDLLEALDLYCDKDFQKWLSYELGVHVAPSGSEKQTNALRKAIVEKLAPNEVEWQDMMERRREEGRCLNCGRLRHLEYRCKADCGKCMTIVLVYGI